MTTNLNEILNQIEVTTVWNFHGSNLANVGFNKNSNLHKELTRIAKTGLKGMVTVFVEAIGRSGHSASRVGIYKGVTSHEDFGMYYSGRHAEYRLDMFVGE